MYTQWIMSIMTLEPQSNFPLEDVSDTNAEKLELLLLNKEIVNKGQRDARMVSWLYKTGNAAIESAIRHIFDENSANALAEGIKTYEALSALVNPLIDIKVHNDPTVHRSIIELHSELRDNTTGALINAHDDFIKFPRTATLVEEHAARFNPGYEDYAKTGAALAHQLESRAIETVYKLQ